jgi:2-dehydro-3-deoxygalactonokinase
MALPTGHPITELPDGIGNGTFLHIGIHIKIGQKPDPIMSPSSFAWWRDTRRIQTIREFSTDMEHTSKPENRSSLWIAAEARGLDWSFWANSGDSVKRRKQARFSGGLNDPEFAQIYMSLCLALEADSAVPLFACGLDGGPTQSVPCRPDACKTAAMPTGEQTALPPALEAIHVVPALSQSSPSALIRHETGRISGFLSLNPGWEGVICLPGATTHWALISAEEVVSFQSFLTTGIASATLASNGLASDDWSAQSIALTAADTISRPELTAARLAEALAAGVVHGASPEDTAGMVWGALLGAELAASRPYWLGQNLAIIGAKEHAAPYVVALEAQGLSVTVADAERMCLAGLTRAWRQREA